MAKRKINKSGAIRDYLKEHPDAGPSAVVEALKANKVFVGMTHVSNVRARMSSGAEVGVRGVGRPKGTGKPIAVAPAGAIGNLIIANDYQKAVGGIEPAIAYLKALQRIQD